MGQGGGCLKPLEQKKVKGKKTVDSMVKSVILLRWKQSVELKKIHQTRQTSWRRTRPRLPEPNIWPHNKLLVTVLLTFSIDLCWSSPNVKFTLLCKQTHTHTHRLNSHRCVWFFSQILFACEHSVSSSSNYDGYPSFSTEVSLTARPRNHPSILLFW